VNWRPFTEARNWTRTLGLKSQTHWQNYRAGRVPDSGPIPSDIPSNPNLTYENSGWRGWGDWLGTGSVAPQHQEFRHFSDARQFVRSLHLSGQREWKTYCTRRLPNRRAKPSDVPSSPDHVYRNNGWIGWSDWLGNEFTATFARAYRPFRRARSWARKLGLSGQREWADYCVGRLRNGPVKPNDIPSSPDHVYRRNGWTGWSDWLGTEFITLRQARQWVRSLGLSGHKQWADYCAGRLINKPPKPAFIPSSPDYVYRKCGWISWGDWLGNGSKRRNRRKRA
jgi:hypothetical protein